MPTAHSHRFLPAALVFASAAGFLAFPAAAETLEEMKKNDAQFIDWLRDKGASDVLEYYSQAHQPKDLLAQISLRIAASSAKIDSVRMDAIKLDQAAQLRAFGEMRKATEAMLDAERERCDKFDGEETSIIWHAKLLSDLMENYLRIYRNDPVPAYEYGQPTPDQTEAFETFVAEAFVRASRADAAADRFDAKMGGSKTYGRQLEKKGLRVKMEDARANIKYWHGQAAYLMTLLPDSHPYYVALGTTGTPGVRGQARDAASERKRLLKLALQSAVRDNVEEMGVDARNLAGRVLAAQGKPADAARYYDNLDTSAVSGAAAMQSLCAQAGMKAAGGKPADLTNAVKWLREQAETVKFQELEADGSAREGGVREQLAKGDTALYLFACDSAFRLIMDASKRAASPQEKKELLNKAFMEPYADVFTDKPAQSDEDKAVAAAKHSLKPLLLARWAEVFKGTPAKDLPPAVGAGKVMIEMGQLFTEGSLWNELKKQADANRAAAAAQQPEQPLDAAKVAKLALQMRRLESDLQNFTAKEAPGAVRAQMLDQLAFLRMYGAQVGVCLVNDTGPQAAAIPPESQTLHACAMGWLTLARELPTEASAQAAIGFAAGILRDLKTQGFYAADYAEACNVLFEKFPDNPAVDAHIFPACADLIARGKLDAAVKLLDGVRSTSLLHFAARQKSLSLREQQWQLLATTVEENKANGKSDPAADTAAAAALDRLMAFATTLEQDAKKEVRAGAAAGYRRGSAHSARASALVSLARAQAAKGNAAQGVSALDKFEEEFAPATLSTEGFEGHEKELQTLQDALAKQVEWAQVCRLRMLMDAGMSDQVRSRADQLLTGSGNDPEKQQKAKNVLFRLNYSIKHEVDRLKQVIDGVKFDALKQEYEQRRVRYGKAMLELTQLLKDKTITPASTQSDRDNMNILEVKAMAASGNSAGAVALAEKLSDAENARLKVENAEIEKHNAQHPEAKKPLAGRSMSLLLALISAKYEHGLSLCFTDPAMARKQLVTAATAAQPVIDSFRNAPKPEAGYPTEYYEAYWVRLDGAHHRAKTQGASEKTIKDAKGIHLVIQRMREDDPEGFAASPFLDFFNYLEKRVQAEQ